MPKQVDDKQVYDATIETILAHGYAGATTKLIAKNAGINEATLFRKYGNKSQLIAAAVSHEALQMEEELVLFTGDIHADLLRVVQGYMHSREKHSQLFPLIMTEMARYPELRETVAGPLGIIYANWSIAGAVSKCRHFKTSRTDASRRHTVGSAYYAGHFATCQPQFPRSHT